MIPLKVLAGALVVAVAGCTAPASLGTDDLTPDDASTPPMAPGLGAGDNVSGPLSWEGTFVLTQVGICDTAVVEGCFGAATLEGGKFEIPENVTRAEVVVSWTAVTPATERLSAFFRADGDAEPLVYDGPSPATWTFPALAARTYHVGAQLASPGGAVVDQRVDWSASAVAP